MARVELAPQVFDDYDRFLDHMVRFEAANPPSQIAEIIDAIQILTHSPLIGRPVSGGKRELVVGSSARGYVALYRYIAKIDTVFVLAVRHQREDLYRPIA